MLFNKVVDCHVLAYVVIPGADCRCNNRSQIFFYTKIYCCVCLPYLMMHAYSLGIKMFSDVIVVNPCMIFKR